MANNNRNWDNQSNRNNQDWNQHRERHDREYDDQQYHENRNYGRGDYDNRENQSYGSLYGGNLERRERETNAAPGGRYERMYRNRAQNYSGGQYGNDRRNAGYGGGQGYSGGNQGYGGQRYNNDDDDRNYGQSSRNYGGDYRGSIYEGSDYNRGQGNRENIYGGDTSNYGNANQGGYDRNWWDKAKEKVSSWFDDDDNNRNRDDSNRGGSQHRGKGPRGYKRSDERIREDICDRLYEDNYVDATDVEVKVEGSEVVLTGSVNSREEKRRAEDLIESISGVQHVENRLRVGNRQNTSGSSSNSNMDSGTRPSASGSDTSLS